MARAALTEIIPGVLYQRGQFLTWPARQKQRVLEAAGITVVVNLWHKIDPDLSPETHDRIYINWHTSPSTVPGDVLPMLFLLEQLMRSGHRLLVHCEAGRGRSVWLAAELYKRWSGMDGEAAYRTVRALVPGANVRPELLEHLYVRNYVGGFTSARAGGMIGP